MQGFGQTVLAQSTSQLAIVNGAQCQRGLGVCFPTPPKSNLKSTTNETLFSVFSTISHFLTKIILQSWGLFSQFSKPFFNYYFQLKSGGKFLVFPFTRCTFLVSCRQKKISACQQRLKNVAQKNEYRGTPLTRSPMGQKYLAETTRVFLTNWGFLQGGQKMGL